MNRVKQSSSGREKRINGIPLQEIFYCHENSNTINNLLNKHHQRTFGGVYKIIAPLFYLWVRPLNAFISVISSAYSIIPGIRETLVESRVSFRSFLGMFLLDIEIGRLTFYIGGS